MKQLLWSFKHHVPGDITLVRVGEEYHLFAEMSAHGQWNGDMVQAVGGPRYVGHAVSRDLYHWEELPIALECGPEGSCDGHMIYHMDVWVEDGRWFMFYTGLDKFGPGQKQVVALATSQDGITWARHPGNPVLTADPRWYEQAIPPEATYQPKDAGRLWFRDPCIIRDKASGEYGMIVIARDASRHPDLRGCIAWATSPDLHHWTAKPPLFSPNQYHTVETPSLYEHKGRHYLVYFTGHQWGTPYDSGDPWQHAGMYYAVSDKGWEGPYERVGDGILLANAGTIPRLGAARNIQAGADDFAFYGWLMLTPEPGSGDVPGNERRTRVIPPARAVRHLPDGRMEVVYKPGIERFTRPATGDERSLVSDDPSRWTADAGRLEGKHFTGRSVTLTPASGWEDGIVSVRLDFIVGHRAGIVFRTQGGQGPGLQVIFDRRLQCIELSEAQTGRVLDARHWDKCDGVHLRVVAIGPSIEVYADDRLVIHQARHREARGQVGLVVQNAQVAFTQWDVRLPA